MWYENRNLLLFSDSFVKTLSLMFACTSALSQPHAWGCNNEESLIKLNIQSFANWITNFDHFIPLLYTDTTLTTLLTRVSTISNGMWTHLSSGFSS